MEETMALKNTSLGFGDMRLRVVNATKPCPVRYSCPSDLWPYGTLYLYLWRDDETIMATFGDLTVIVSGWEAIVLLSIAVDAESPFGGQW